MTGKLIEFDIGPSLRLVPSRELSPRQFECKAHYIRYRCWEQARFDPRDRGALSNVKRDEICEWKISTLNITNILETILLI